MLRIIKNVVYQIVFLYKNIFLSTFYKIKKFFVKERRLPTLPFRFNRNVNYNEYWIPNNSNTYLDTEKRWNTNNNSSIWTDGEWIGGTWNTDINEYVVVQHRWYNATLNSRWNTLEKLDSDVQKRKNRIDNLYKDDE